MVDSKLFRAPHDIEQSTRLDYINHSDSFINAAVIGTLRGTIELLQNEYKKLKAEKEAEQKARMEEALALFETISDRIKNCVGFLIDSDQESTMKDCLDEIDDFYNKWFWNV